MANGFNLPENFYGYREQPSPPLSTEQDGIIESGQDAYSVLSYNSQISTGDIESLDQIAERMRLDDGPRFDCVWVTLSRLTGRHLSDLVSVNQVLHYNQYQGTTIPYLVQTLEGFAASSSDEWRYSAFGLSGLTVSQDDPEDAKAPLAERVLNNLLEKGRLTTDLGALYYHADGTGHCVVWNFDEDRFLDYQTDEVVMDVTAEVRAQGLVALFAISNCNSFNYVEPRRGFLQIQELRQAFPRGIRRINLQSRIRESSPIRHQ